MKTVRNFLGVLMLMMLTVSVAIDSQAQGRGHGKDKGEKENHRGKGQDKKRDGGWDKKGKHDRHHEYARSDHYHRGHYVKYNYNHNRGGRHWAPRYGYRYNTRYIYYRDYNVYYDCYRDVFVTWTGRNWIVTHQVPVAFARVDFGRTAVVGVDYWDDDFNFYLARRRPAFISIQASF